MDNIKNLETESKQVERVTTKLKFTKSELTGTYVGYASRNPVNGCWHGVREDSEYPKVICVLDKKLAWEVIPNLLYDVTMIPMAEKAGFVVIRISPCSFKATVEISYFPTIRYRVYVKFGNKKIIFDPYEGNKESIWSLPACRAVLEKRVDVKDLPQVVEDFTSAAACILNKMKKDGVTRKNENEEGKAAQKKKEKSH